MPSFMDIVATPETVKIEGQDCPVHGVSFDGISALLVRFPWITDALLSGKEVKLDELNLKDMLTKAPVAAVAIGAAALGYPGNEAAEEKFRLLPFGTQLEVLAKAKKRTMPDGLSPFVDSLRQLGILVPVEQSASGNAGQASTSRTRSSARRKPTVGRRNRPAVSRPASSPPISGSAPDANAGNAPIS